MAGASRSSSTFTNWSGRPSDTTLWGQPPRLSGGPEASGRSLMGLAQKVALHLNYNRGLTDPDPAAPHSSTSPDPPTRARSSALAVSAPSDQASPLPLGAPPASHPPDERYRLE